MTTFRPWRVPDDFSHLAEIASASFWGTLTAADFQTAEKSLPAQALLHRLVATGPGGRVIAYGTGWRPGPDSRALPALPPGFAMRRPGIPRAWDRSGGQAAGNPGAPAGYGER